MKCSYRDILSRIPEKPLWFDEYGVPRYEAFNPKRVANIYANEVALLSIECQVCYNWFDVAVSCDLFHSIHNETKPLSQLAPALFYGDPPNIGCCPSGPSMTSITKKILEF